MINLCVYADRSSFHILSSQELGFCLWTLIQLATTHYQSTAPCFPPMGSEMLNIRRKQCFDLLCPLPVVVDSAQRLGCLLRGSLATAVVLDFPNASTL